MSTINGTFYSNTGSYKETNKGVSSATPCCLYVVNPGILGYEPPVKIGDILCDSYDNTYSVYDIRLRSDEITWEITLMVGTVSELMKRIIKDFNIYSFMDRTVSFEII